MTEKNHTVRAYDEELIRLSAELAEMGGMAESMVADSLTALSRMDTKLAQRVIATDARMDFLQRDIEERAIRVIVKRQPMALDLREVVGCMRISADLERVGDLAKNISKRVVAISGGLGTNFGAKKVIIGLEHLSSIALEQLKAVLDAYRERSVTAAAIVRERDDEIDALYTSLFRELLTYMMEDPRNITFCTHLLFCAKNLERVGDHATNIAETVHYVVTGQQLVDDRPKGDSTAVMPEG
ncbi:MAG: phosphate signaling complex protein PhoU [Hyphomicrobiaceae bacterium]|nr:phosphate signaling complex protein PhoU [Hyphomicrobiaceae bacterium]